MLQPDDAEAVEEAEGKAAPAALAPAAPLAAEPDSPVADAGGFGAKEDLAPAARVARTESPVHEAAPTVSVSAQNDAATGGTVGLEERF